MKDADVSGNVIERQAGTIRLREGSNFEHGSPAINASWRRMRNLVLREWC